MNVVYASLCESGERIRDQAGVPSNEAMSWRDSKAQSLISSKEALARRAESLESARPVT